MDFIIERGLLSPRLVLLLREFHLKNSPSHKSFSVMNFSFILCALSYVVIQIFFSCLILEYLLEWDI